MLRYDPLTQPDDPRVIELSPEGDCIAGWGGDIIADSHMLTADSEGRILCVDRDMHEVIISSNTAERLGRWRPMLNSAHGLFGTSSGDILLAEANPSRLTRLVRLT